MIKPFDNQNPQRESIDEIMPDVLTEEKAFLSDVLDNSDGRMIPIDPYVQKLHIQSIAFPIYKDRFMQELSTWEFAIQYRTGWKKCIDMQCLQGTSIGDSIGSSVTLGMSTTEASTFGFELGVSVTAEAGDGLFTKISATISSSFNESYTFEKTIIEERSVTLKPLSFVALKTCMVTLWQMECRFQIVCRKKGSDDNSWVKIHDSPYISLSEVYKWDVFPHDAMPNP